jgi:hypothetical protein
MKGLDFWATDEWTDDRLPFWDDWSVKFMLREWQLELLREELKMLLARCRG